MSATDPMAPSTVTGAQDVEDSSLPARQLQPSQNGNNSETSHARSTENSEDCANTNNKKRTESNSSNCDAVNNNGNTLNDSLNNRTENDNRTSGCANEHNDELINCVNNKVSGDVSNEQKKTLNSNKDNNNIDIDELRTLRKEQFLALSHDDIWEKWQLLFKKIDGLESRGTDNKLPSSEDGGDVSEQLERYKTQIAEVQRKEAYHVMRLTTKEHELQEMAASVAASKCFTIGRGSLLDPAVNLTIERLKKDLEAARTKMEEAQNELAAWKFTPDSNTGKQLMAKCRLLIKENEELGRVISSGKLAKLEGDIALQRNFTEELKKSQSELDEFLLEMDEDTEGMQGTIVYLQDQLRVAKLQLQQAHSSSSSPTPTAAAPPAETLPGEDNPAELTSQESTPNEQVIEEDTPADAQKDEAVTTVKEEVPSGNDSENAIEEQVLCGETAMTSNLSSSTEVTESQPEEIQHESTCKAIELSPLKTERLSSSPPVEKSVAQGDSILASVESQIIPHGDPVLKGDVETNEESESVVLNGGGNKKRTLEDGVDGESVEPVCKRTKAIILGDNNSSDEPPAETTTSAGLLENGVKSEE